MESADPSDQHKVAVVRVGNSVKLIDYMEEIEATADASVPARWPRQSGAGSLGQARLEENRIQCKGMGSDSFGGYPVERQVQSTDCRFFGLNSRP
jgi:hypothetical protein